MGTATKTKKGLEYSTNFDRLLKAGRPIYVRNKMNPAAQVSLNLHDKAGNTKHGMIPPTWIPIDITAMFPRSFLREAYDIKQYIMKGVLEIVPQAQAEKQLSTKDAQDELTRITKSKFSGRNVEKAMKELRSAKKDVDRNQRDAELSILEDDETGNVSDRTRDICIRLEENSITSSEALSELKGQMGNLTEDDYQYVLASCNSSKIKKWAKRKLAEVTGEDDAPSRKARKSVASSSRDEDADDEDASDDEDDDDEDFDDD
jgi:hypothetical protein